VTTAAKRKGDRYELELARQLHDQTGWPVRRKLGAGRQDDTGDLDGLPDCVAQVKAYVDIARAIREGLPELEQQHANTTLTHAVLFVRRPGGRWIAVQTLEQWATEHREATT
jgi:Holliday junction resolvase